jgi:hypothetical protein
MLMNSIQSCVFVVCTFFLSLFSATGAIANEIQGPSSSQTLYVERAQKGSGVVTTSILTVGDYVNLKPDNSPYYMVGIPDGLGAFDNGDGTFTVLMNHELSSGEGIVRAHGAIGSFVSKWIIRKEDLTVLHGEDLIQQVVTWNPLGFWNDPATGVVLARLCSADLPKRTAFFDEESGLGYDGYLYLNGEEVSGGRGFAHTLDGTSYELPWLGKFAFENAVAHPDLGETTIVIATDDTTPGQVYIYAGQKTNSSNAAEAAGLTNGVLYGLKVTGLPVEMNDTVLAGPTPFTVFNFGDASLLSAATLESLGTANEVTAFQRPEDGAWDPTHPNDFYFVTTASFTTNSRLWRLRFIDPANPGLGGTIEMLLDGSEGQRMMDNLTINNSGQIFIQEDPGNQPHNAKIWRYHPDRDNLSLIAQHDPNRFVSGAPGFLTQDEESSGIIDVSDILGEGKFLLDVQAHYSIAGELVQGGQLLLMQVPSGRK